MRGRRPQGTEYVNKLEGSVEDKERLKVILDTMSGQLRRLQACAELNIGETRFWQLRDPALQGALDALAALQVPARMQALIVGAARDHIEVGEQLVDARYRRIGRAAWLAALEQRRRVIARKGDRQARPAGDFEHDFVLVCGFLSNSDFA